MSVFPFFIDTLMSYPQVSGVGGTISGSRRLIKSYTDMSLVKSVSCLDRR